MVTKDMKTGRRIYPLGDKLTSAERERFDCLYSGRRPDGKYVAAIAPENRMVNPSPGDWYISGAEPAAYRAVGFVRTPYMAAELVLVERTQITVDRIVEL